MADEHGWRRFYKRAWRCVVCGMPYKCPHGCGYLTPQEDGAGICMKCGDEWPESETFGTCQGNNAWKEG